MKQTLSESQLAQYVVTWLQDHQWTVYQEVPLCRQGGIRADIFATNGNITWAIETKTSFGLQVLAQAWEWTKHAHYVSIAVPYRKYNSATYAFERELFKKYGIGMIYIRSFGSNELLSEMAFDVNEEYKPVLHRNISKPKLHEKYKTFSQAGNNQCSFYSAFKETRENIVNRVKKNNPISFADLIEKTDHHYKTQSTAKSCLRQYLNTKIIPELETYTEGNRLMVRLTGTTSTLTTIQEKANQITDPDILELQKAIQCLQLSGSL